MGKVREDLTKETVSEELLGRKPFSKEFLLLNILINPYFIRCFAFFPICWRWNRISLCFDLLPLFVGRTGHPSAHSHCSLSPIYTYMVSQVSFSVNFRLITYLFFCPVVYLFIFFFLTVCGGVVFVFWWWCFKILDMNSLLVICIQYPLPAYDLSLYLRVFFFLVCL